MVTNISNVEAAMLAGFFDADGSVGIYVYPKSTPTLYVNVSGTHRESVERYHRLFGGSFRQKTFSGHFGQKPMWVWSSTGQVAKVTLSTMIPYLVVKKDQAFEALKFPVNPRDGLHRPGDREYKRMLGARIVEMKRAIS